MLAWLLTSDALALSCLWGVYDFNFQDGQTVPPDVTIVASHTFSEPENEGGFRILDGNAEEVPVRVEWLPFVVRIHPIEPLAPGEYALIQEDAYDQLFEPTFVVDGTEPPPPPAPDLSGARRIRKNSRDWGTTEGIELSFTEVEGAASYEIELAGNASFDDASLAVANHADVFVGNDLCGPTIEDYDHSVQSFVRVRSVGIDGTPSAWSDPLSVAPGPLDVFTGCSVQCGAPLSGGALAIALVLWSLGLRRRDPDLP